MPSAVARTPVSTGTEMSTPVWNRSSARTGCLRFPYGDDTVPETGIPIGVAIQVIADVCEGLHYAHERADDDGDLPADGAGGEGFDNAAETLFLSPMHAEKYLEAAREALAAKLFELSAQAPATNKPAAKPAADDSKAGFKLNSLIVRSSAAELKSRPRSTKLTGMLYSENGIAVFKTRMRLRSNFRT